jgi:hypothetical protein
VVVLSVKHRVMKKSFETEMRVNGEKIPLNHFVQETMANVMMGFLRTLKEIRDSPTTLEIKIKQLPKEMDVDSHTYP